MKEFKVTYFFDQEHYVRRFIFIESQEAAEKLVQSERDQYISFTDSRGIYHELNTNKVRIIQISEYHRVDKSKKAKEDSFDQNNFYS
ncbi:hypothetical protein [Rummeliibacillus pycnus]|uniref:hypothetical protein n=1 Tax=Rummeliibacillus pycnus TaxID=101070 RepID=UPI000C9A5049|nr:hypothetical protein [Rummeliibacillus pycnus]